VPPLDPAKEQQKVIAANKAAAPGAAELARLSQEQIKSMMNFAIPGFDSAAGLLMGGVIDLLRGKIPLDVSQERKRQSAGRALIGGYAGTDASSKLEARDLGLTSLGLQEKGRSSLESWMREMEQLYSPSEALFTGMMKTPQQWWQEVTQERDVQYEKTWLQEQIDSMQAPWAEDLKQFVYRAMSAYSGTAVKDNPYNTPGSFGGGGNDGGGYGSYNGINWTASDWKNPGNPTTDKPYDWKGTGDPTTDQPFDWSKF